MEVVGNGFQPFRMGALRQAQGDLPLPPEGDNRGEGGKGRRQLPVFLLKESENFESFLLEMCF